MYEVIYFSRSGNTMKLAAAIAGELKVKARQIHTVKTIPPETDIFLGSGLYLLRPSKSVRSFIKNNYFKGKRVALFGTSSTGIGIETMVMEWLLKRKGAVIIGKYYCGGQFRLRIAGKNLFFRKNRPADKDLEKAREFARVINHKQCNTKIENTMVEEGYENRVLSRI